MFSCARKIILNYTFFLIAMIYCRRLGSHFGAKIPFYSLSKYRAYLLILFAYQIEADLVH